MAHSLFEPAPTPFSEKLWRRVKDLNIGFTGRPVQPRDPIGETYRMPQQQAQHLDARGRQEFLTAVLTTDPFK